MYLNWNRTNQATLRLSLVLAIVICLSALKGFAGGIVGNKLNSNFDHELYQRLVVANDQTVSKLLSGDIYNANPRNLSFQFGVLVASYCVKESEYFDDDKVAKQLSQILDLLLLAQRQNGTIDAGGNKQSPPDTAFLIDNLGPAANVLATRDSEEALQLKKRLDSFLLQAGEALLTGGVHTPNHRWVISSALGRLYEIYGDSKYKKRMEAWLAEGIYLDRDGQFPERSRIYSAVVDQALISIARSLDREDLLEPVRRNLQTTYYLMEDNGDLVSLESRRQDQNMTIPATNYYWCYRFMANNTNDLFFAAVAQKIEQLPAFDHDVLSHSIIHFLDSEALREEIKSTEKLSLNYEKYFATCDLVRLKKGSISTTVFGGNDLPLAISSGRSCNPSFLSFRKGEAILNYVRLSSSFFNMGYFRSEGLTKDGNKYKLQETKEAYYFQPMVAEHLNSEGDYELSESPDRRYWSKLDFQDREKSNVQQLETIVELAEQDGMLTMDIQITGVSGIDVTLDFCFDPKGCLSNALPAKSDQEFFLKEGYAVYKAGNDSIMVGPGIYGHDRVEKIDGEAYSTHFGSIKGRGIHLYLTGKTPFTHSIKIR